MQTKLLVRVQEIYIYLDTIILTLKGMHKLYLYNLKTLVNAFIHLVRVPQKASISSTMPENSRLLDFPFREATFYVILKTHLGFTCSIRGIHFQEPLRTILCLTFLTPMRFIQDGLLVIHSLLLMSRMQCFKNMSKVFTCHLVDGHLSCFQFADVKIMYVDP